jgi:hypothetical protein
VCHVQKILIALAATVIAALVIVTAVNAKTAPTFSDYPSTEGPMVLQAPLRLDKDTHHYRTRIRKAAKGQVNFAGHFILVTWGCGTGCEEGAIIDLSTGKTQLLPFAIHKDADALTDDNPDRISFRRDSRLVVFNGQRNEKGPDGLHYYEFDGQHLRFIATTPIESQVTSQTEPFSGSVGATTPETQSPAGTPEPWSEEMYQRDIQQQQEWGRSQGLTFTSPPSATPQTQSQRRLVESKCRNSKQEGQRCETS